jgi:hypothetical protein
MTKEKMVPMVVCMVGVVKEAEKHNRKGMKKHGMYIHNHAASFESLPPGPDPKSVVMDIHKYLPELTKCAALFCQNQQTTSTRWSLWSL